VFTINELEGAMFDIHKKKENSAENKIAKKMILMKLLKGNRDAIDLFFMI
jgi:hypothetical protein